MSDSTIGTMAESITGSFNDLTQLITASAYLAGFAFSATQIAEFKAHKDNPTQVPVGTPSALLLVGAALIFAQGKTTSAS